MKTSLTAFGQAFVHGEAFAVPVAGGAQLAELLQDDAAILFLPLPNTRHQPIAAQVVTALAFGLEGGLHLVLEWQCPHGRCPAATGASWPSMRFQRIRRSWMVLLRIWPMVQHARDVGRRNHDGVTRARGLGVGVKQSLLHPVLIPPRIPRPEDHRPYRGSSCDVYSVCKI